MARQTGGLRRLRLRRAANWSTAGFTLLVASTSMTPVVGLALPLLRATEFRQAAGVIGRTAADTLLYAAGAGGIATLFGLLLALSVGRDNRLRTVCLDVCLAMLALPPATGSLGIVHLAAGAPAWADLLLRSRATVCVVLGLRFLPVAVVLAMRAWQAMPVSWGHAAELHGVALVLYIRRVVIPFPLPTVSAAVVIVALLATADVGSVLLLHPPGRSSLPLAIFTIMANAPDSLVASLCLAYLGLAGGLLALVSILMRRRTP